VEPAGNIELSAIPENSVDSFIWCLHETNAGVYKLCVSMAGSQN